MRPCPVTSSRPSETEGLRGGDGGRDAPSWGEGHCCCASLHGRALISLSQALMPPPHRLLLCSPLSLFSRPHLSASQILFELDPVLRGLTRSMEALCCQVHENSSHVVREEISSHFPSFPSPTPKTHRRMNTHIRARTKFSKQH